jgi:outer membrane lipoprotein-sorting protein
MKRLFHLTLALMLMVCATATAQTARSVLDKTAATLGNKNGVSARFSISGSQYGNSSGSIYVKGRKFHATTSMASVWFDGTTQWTYMKRNNEVNVSHPTESQLQTINPMNFISMYKSGYSYTMTTKNGKYVVHLKATKQRQVKEMYITIDKKTYVPSQIRMLQGKGWSTITISNFKTAKLSDSTFRFNSRDYPSAEVIDLR